MAHKIQLLSVLTAQPEAQLLLLAVGRMFSQKQMLQPQHFACFSPNKYWNRTVRLPGVAEEIHYFSRLIITIFFLHWSIIISFRNTQKGNNFSKAVLNIKSIHHNRTLTAMDCTWQQLKVVLMLRYHLFKSTMSFFKGCVTRHWNKYETHHYPLRSVYDKSWGAAILRTWKLFPCYF